MQQVQPWKVKQTNKQTICAEYYYNRNKNTQKRKNNRLDYTEECISDLEDRIVEKTQSEQKIKRIKKNKCNLRDLIDNITCSKFHIISL